MYTVGTKHSTMMDDVANINNVTGSDSAKFGLRGKFRSYINKDKAKTVPIAIIKHDGVIDYSTPYQVKEAPIESPKPIRNQTVKRFSSEADLLVATKQERLKRSLEQENRSLERKFHQVYGELLTKMRQQNIRVERGTKVIKQYSTHSSPHSTQTKLLS